jgi:hypothetical protein
MQKCGLHGIESGIEVTIPSMATLSEHVSSRFTLHVYREFGQILLMKCYSVGRLANQVVLMQTYIYVYKYWNSLSDAFVNILIKDNFALVFS